jgi:excisionase family DNA binding protein
MEALLDVEDAATVLSLSPWTIRAYIQTGKLQPVRLGRRVLLEPAEIRRLIAEGKGAPKSRVEVKRKASQPKGDSQ